MAVLSASGTGAALRRNRAKALLVVAAAAALAAAIVLPAELPEWLRSLMGLGSGDATAATPWLRGLLVAIALALLLLGRRLDQVAWPDAALLLVAALVGFAAVSAFRDAQAKTEEEAVDAVTFMIDEAKAVALAPLTARTEIVLLVVEPEKSDDDTPLSYTATRHEATLETSVAAGEAQTDVAVSIERGEEDSDASAFAADLNGATAVYLLPPSTKKENEQDDGTDGKSGRAPTHSTAVESTP